VPEPPRRPEATNPDGFLIDIDVQDITDPVPKVTPKERSRDVDHFFSPAYQSKSKNYRNCRTCSCVHAPFHALVVY